MPRFHYSSTLPDAGSIADLMLRRGEIAGRRARTVGDISAQAHAARGQIWGQTIGSIGDIIGGSVQQYAQDTAAAPDLALARATKAADLELKNAQIEDMQQQTDDRARVTRQDTAFMGLMEKGKIGRASCRER